MSTLHYTFNYRTWAGNFDEYDYEYEVDTRPFFDQLSDEEVVDLASEVISQSSEDDVKAIMDEYDYHSTKLDAKDPKSVSFARHVVKDTDEEVLTEIMKDDVKSFFENEAYEEFEDSLAYERDPLGYYGMSLRDFI